MPTINKNKEIHSIFMGRKIRKFHEINSWGYFKPELIEKTETIERVKVSECNLKECLKEKDEIYLHEKGVYTTIQKVTTGTDGNMYYNVSYVDETIDDTKPTYDELLLQYNKILDEYNKDKEKCHQEYKLQQEKEKIEKDKKLSDINEIKKWQSENPDKIKGIIIEEIPKGKDGNFLLNKDEFSSLIINTKLTVPKEYLVVSSLNNITYLDTSDKNLSINLNDNI